MTSIGIVFLTDGKTSPSSNKVIIQDGKDLQYGLSRLGYDAHLYYDDDFDESLKNRPENVDLFSMIEGFEDDVAPIDDRPAPEDNDLLIVEYGGVLDFGGDRRKTVSRMFKFINEFDGPVVLSSNDLRDTVSINSMQRDKWGDDRILRPVYYASPVLINGNEDRILSRYKRIDFSRGIPFDFVAGVAWRLANGDAGYDPATPFNMDPKYTVSYGGSPKNAKFTARVLSAFEHLGSDGAVSYGQFAKVNGLKTVFDRGQLSRSDLMREVNDESKWTLYVNEAGKGWMTSRLFEQGLSSGLMVFDKGAPRPEEWEDWVFEADLLDGSRLDEIASMPETRRIDLAMEQREKFKTIDYEGWTRKAYKSLVDSALD